MCAENYNLVLARNKLLIILVILLVFLGIGGALTKQTQGSVLNSVILQTALRGNYNVNKYRMVFIRLIEIYMRSLSARSERSRVCEKRHPGGDCPQRP